MPLTTDMMKVAQSGVPSFSNMCTYSISKAFIHVDFDFRSNKLPAAQILVSHNDSDNMKACPAYQSVSFNFVRYLALVDQVYIHSSFRSIAKLYFVFTNS